MFRNKPYFVEDVAQQVLDHIHDPANAHAFADELTKSVSRHPRPVYSDAMIKAYGQSTINDMLQTWDNNVAKEAITACINKAFTAIIGAGVTNNPYAPATIEAVDQAVIEKTLGKIRAVRKGSVQRAYTARRK